MANCKRIPASEDNLPRWPKQFKQQKPTGEKQMDKQQFDNATAEIWKLYSSALFLAQESQLKSIEGIKANLQEKLSNILTNLNKGLNEAVNAPAA
jgi:hypothetical protein